MSEKIYCMLCKFISDVPFIHEGCSKPFRIEKGCHYPENVESIPMVGNWYTDICADRTILHPSEINAKNDCHWFEKATGKMPRDQALSLIFK